jgi:alpha-beta hydrolase superfamily lysophospholipase
MSTRAAVEGHFSTWDGTELFCRTWAPETESRKALILIHRGHEHSGRLQGLVDMLALPDFWAFSWDNRGHGRSPGERGYARHYMDLVRDLDAFVHHVCGKHEIPVENVAIVANSVGAVTAATWVHDYAPRIRAMVLAAPAFRIRLYVPGAIPSLRLLQKVREKSSISSYVKSRMLTHDPEQMKAYDEDDLITRNIAVNVLLGLHDVATRIMADAGAIVTPTLLLSAGADYVVKNAAQQRFFDGLSSTHKAMETYPGFFHALLYETERHRPTARARAFLLEAFEAEVDRSFLRDADKGGYTFEEYERLRGPETGWRRPVYGTQRLALRTVGRLSDGVRVGWETGFDSGKSLDYVYENRARGKTPLGRWIDRGYLDAIGWRGIRERGELLKSCLRESIARLRAAGQPIRILDIAAGCGRYVLEVLKDEQRDDIRALLRDRAPHNLEAGLALAAGMGLDGVTFEEGDAFDADSIRQVEPRPNIVIVSGLYELFPENGMILASLGGIAGALQDGGVLLYTCQPWHPQIEVIARTLVNRDGVPWIMRRRTQAEMDELVRSVGLEKEAARFDAYGIFTVSVAHKRGGGIP